MQVPTQTDTARHPPQAIEPFPTGVTCQRKHDKSDYQAHQRPQAQTLHVRNIAIYIYILLPVTVDDDG